ncbi:MAG: hypothetical protein KGI51_01965 [Rhodospirillales bacterium]|nr:hypothetical protein [Rhodospirillales bacterium]
MSIGQRIMIVTLFAAGVVTVGSGEWGLWHVLPRLPPAEGAAVIDVHSVALGMMLIAVGVAHWARGAR